VREFEFASLFLSSLSLFVLCVLVTRCRFLFGESLDNNWCSRIGACNAIGESSLVIMTSLALLDQFDKKHFSFRLTQARRRVTLLTPRAQRTILLIIAKLHPEPSSSTKLETITPQTKANQWIRPSRQEKTHKMSLWRSKQEKIPLLNRAIPFLGRNIQKF